MPITTEPALPRDLEPGDEILLSNGDQIFVEDAYEDPDGTWVDFSDGDSGYVRENRPFQVIIPAD